MIYAYWILRIGFGLSYIYSGSDMFSTPSHWYGYVPQWFSRAIIDAGFTVDQFLKAQGSVEMIIGVIFLLWFLERRTFGRGLLRMLYIFVAVQMALILLFSGIDPNTFRDIVFFAAAVALFFLERQRMTQKIYE